MSIYEREWSPEPEPVATTIPTTLAEASADASKTLITYLEAARKNVSIDPSNVILKACTITDDRVIAGVRSTTFTATFRDVVEQEKVVGEGEVERERDICERAHLTIRLFVGPGCESPPRSRGSVHMKK